MVGKPSITVTFWDVVHSDRTVSLFVLRAVFFPRLFSCKFYSTFIIFELSSFRLLFLLLTVASCANSSMLYLMFSFVFLVYLFGCHDLIGLISVYFFVTISESIKLETFHVPAYPPPELGPEEP